MVLENIRDTVQNTTDDVVNTVTDTTGDFAEWEESTRDDRWELYFGDAADSGGFLKRTYGAADSWLTFGYLPGGADPIIGGGGGGGAGGGGPSIPTWLPIVGLLVAGILAVVYGGDM